MVNIDIAANHAARLVALVASAGLAVSTLEWLVPAGKLSAGDLFHPSLGVQTDQNSTRWQRWWRPSGLRAVLWLRFSASVVSIPCLLVDLRGGGVPCLLAALLSLLLRLDEPVGIYIGMDGAEHVLTTCLLTLSIAFFVPSVWALRAALAFITLQASLEYGSAGWVKALQWRAWARGTHLQRVLSSSNFGHPWLAARGVALPLGALSISVILLEVTLPCAVLLPQPWAECLLAAAFGFHVSCAVLMGFGTFVWAFAATFPAILLCRDWLHGLV